MSFPDLTSITVVGREPRRMFATQNKLNPRSLCGSYALRSGGDQIQKGLIVAEPQADVYLIELVDLVTDKPACQRLVTIEELTKIDDDGSEWTFYDTPEAITDAFREGLMS